MTLGHIINIRYYVFPTYSFIFNNLSHILYHLVFSEKIVVPLPHMIDKFESCK